MMHGHTAYIFYPLTILIAAVLIWTAPKIHERARPILIGSLLVIAALNIGRPMDSRMVQLLRTGSSAGLEQASTAKPDTRQYNGCSILDERPSIDATMILFLCFGFGGLLVEFLPLYWCLLVPSSVNYQRLLFGVSLVGGCCASGAIVWFFLSGVYPYTWGLPPQWIPAKWNQCQENEQYRFSHPRIVLRNEYCAGVTGHCYGDPIITSSDGVDVASGQGDCHKDGTCPEFPKPPTKLVAYQNPFAPRPEKHADTKDPDAKMCKALPDIGRLWINVKTDKVWECVGEPHIPAFRWEERKKDKKAAIGVATDVATNVAIGVATGAATDVAIDKGCHWEQDPVNGGMVVVCTTPKKLAINEGKCLPPGCCMPGSKCPERS